MNLNSIKRKLKKIFEEDFVSVEKGTWNDGVHFIHIRAKYCSLNQALEISSIFGDVDPLLCGDYEYNVKIVIDLNTMK